MIIKSFRVANYGVFSDFQVDGLGPGTTVITGPNEAGKSTLLVFLRHTLFGYPDRRTKAVQPPATTGTPSGTVTLADHAGGVYTVSRAQGKSAVVHLPDGSEAGDDFLAGLLGNFDAPSYQAVFGFDLADLAVLQALDEEKVSDRLLSAGITGAGDTVQKTVSALEKIIGENLKPRSGAALNTMAAKVKELEAKRKQAEEAQSAYGEMMKNRALRLEESATLLEEIDRLTREGERLRTLINLKPAAIRFKRAEEELERLDAPPTFPENALRRFEKICEELASLSSEKARLEAEDSDLAEQLRQNAPDLLWLEKAGEIDAVNRGLPVWEAALEETLRLKAERDSLEAAVKAHLMALGSTWTVEKVRNLDTGLETKARIRRMKDRLDAVTAECAAMRTDAARAEARAGEMAKAARSAPLLQKAFIPALIAASALAAVSTVVPEGFRPPMFALAGIASGVSLMLFLRRGDRGLESAAILAGAEAENRASSLREAEEKLQKLASEWRRTLEILGIPSPEEAGPDFAVDLIDRADAAKRDMAELARREKRFSEILDETRSFEERVRAALAPLLTETAGKDGRGLMALLHQAASRAKAEEEKAAKSADLKNLREKLFRRLEMARSAEASKKDALKTFLDSAGASGEEDFRSKEAAFTARLEHLKTMNETGLALESHLGKVDRSAPFYEELFAGGIEGWNAALEKARNNLEEKRAAHAEANRAYGALGAALGELETSDRLADLGSEIENARSEARIAAGEWRKAVLARHLVRSALDGYARDRQPAVLAEASGIFSEMTGGRYRKVLQPAGGKEIRVERADGLLYRPEELSRGTREELYLALRLGLAGEFAARGAKLPVMADDVFVNFDPERKKRAIRAVTGRAAGRQAIIFTCHPETVEEIKKADPGAVIIEMEPKGPRGG